MSEAYLLLKRGYYERPNHAGYTSLKSEAGRYDRAEVERLLRVANDGLWAVSLEDAAPSSLDNDRTKRVKIVGVADSRNSPPESPTGEQP